MPLIAYWIADQYVHDRERGFDFSFNSNSTKLVTVPDGETVWLFSRVRTGATYLHPLVGKLMVQGRENNPRNRAWKYHILGDPGRSEYYEPRGQGSVEDIIRAAGFGIAGEPLGRSFRGAGNVKVIPVGTHADLTRYAAGLTRLRL